MLHRLLILIAALLLPAGAWAQDVEGAWDFRLDNTTIFRFVIEQGEDGEWRGEWSRPDSFNSNGDAFARLRGPVETLDSMAGYEFLGSVELSFDDPRPGAVPDIFRFRVVDEDSLEMIYVGTGLDPYELVRAGPGDVIGDWDASKIYRRSEQGDFTVTEVVDPAAPRPRTRIFELDFSLAPPGGEEEPAAEEGEAAADTVSVEESEETDPADALPELAVEDGLIDDNV
ncbi:MAG: hypothetical protein GWN87_19095, partial [Desulfuromonadales bacterium]|nr:hypothetical protein [Desulfuromonadales bacterium]NIS42162.1 hypothetical protein [Desulfuromonadales bacterium]